MEPQESQQQPEVDNKSSSASSAPFGTEMSQASPLGNGKKSKLRLIAVTLAVVLVVGAITTALVVRSIYNRPENVVAAALGNYLLDGEDKNFDTKISMSLEEAVMGVKSVEVNTGVQMSGKTVQLELEIASSAITLKGALQSNENGNFYVKIQGLPALLATEAMQSYGLPEEMRAQIASLNDKWIEIKADDMASLTGESAGENAFDKCTTALYAALDNDNLGKLVDKAYKRNKFIVAKSSSEDVIENKKLLKVEIGLDEAKLDAFGAEIEKSEDFKQLKSTCGLDDTSKPRVSGDSSDEIKNGAVTVWVDRGKKRLIKVEAVGDSFEKGQKVMGMKMVMTTKKPAEKLEAPSDVVNIVSVLQQFGIDPTMLSGATQ